MLLSNARSKLQALPGPPPEGMAGHLQVDGQRPGSPGNNHLSPALQENKKLHKKRV